MFEVFPGRFLQNCHWFCICATTALCKNEKKKGNIQVLSLDEACYGYYRPTKNIFKLQENDHLRYSSKNILFPLDFQFFALSVS